MDNNKPECRFLPAEQLRIAKKDGKIAKIIGYAAVFDSFSEDFGGWREKIEPGAFAKSIKTDDIRALIDHNSSLVLGRNRAGTLHLAEDKHGLLVEITPPETNAGRDIIVSIERGDVTGMSFRFETGEDAWNVENGQDVRTLKRVKLFDISAVTFPAYPETDVAVRSRELWLNTKKPANYSNLEIMRMQLQLEEAGS